jgi:hypothetical protein
MHKEVCLLFEHIIARNTCRWWGVRLKMLQDTLITGVCIRKKCVYLQPKKRYARARKAFAHAQRAYASGSDEYSHTRCICDTYPVCHGRIRVYTYGMPQYAIRPAQPYLMAQATT